MKARGREKRVGSAVPKYGGPISLIPEDFMFKDNFIPKDDGIA